VVLRNPRPPSSVVHNARRNEERARRVGTSRRVSERANERGWAHIRLLLFSSFSSSSSSSSSSCPDSHTQSLLPHTCLCLSCQQPLVDQLYFENVRASLIAAGWNTRSSKRNLSFELTHAERRICALEIGS